MKLAFIDHSFHQKSTATRFLIELFEEYCSVEVFWDQSWNGGSRVDISTLNDGTYDVIVFFQMLDYPLDAIKSLSCQNVIFVPMYDGSSTLSGREWLKFRKYRFINFSSTLHRKMRRLGLVSLRVQYFPDPAEFEVEENFDDLRGFFWQRTDGITWNHVSQLIGVSEFRKFHIHTAVDPHGFKFIRPSLEERQKYSITMSDWFDEKKDYLRTMQKANIYFAPRQYEGIGMSFLEAMTMGKCVVAVDHPTMNEYISDGIDGYLYDIQSVQPVDLSRAREIGKRAREKCILGYERWVADKDLIVEFVSRQNSRVGFIARTVLTSSARTVGYASHLSGKMKAVIKKVIMKCCSR